MQIMSTSKGLHVNVLRSTLGDCTAGGVTSKYDTFLLVGEGIPELFEAREGEVVLRLVKRNIGGKEYLHVEPTEEITRGRWVMFGGNFIFSSDSRFRNVSQYPLAVHDRIEG